MPEQTQTPAKDQEKAPLTIIVYGTSAVTRAPERAVVSIIVSSEDSNQEAVSKDVTATSKSLQKLFTELSSKADSGQPTPEAPVTAWSMRALCTSSRPTYGAKDAEFDRKYVAETMFELEFRDFGKMGAVTTQLLAMPNVNIDNTAWQLTEKTKESLGSQLRQKAVQDAMVKARDFAEATGCKEVRPFEVTDWDSAPDAPHGWRGRTYGRPMRDGAVTGSPAVRGYGAAEDAELSFAPEDIQLRANVTVKFHAE
jgi:uncharacterized protein YggE